jgi:hypothetical protein
MTCPSASACTLDPSDQTSALGWIADLNAGALRDWRRDDLRLTLTYAPDARERVIRMIREEAECCGFLRFTVSDAPGEIVVIVTAPETARETVAPIFDALTTPPACAVGCGCAPETTAKSGAKERWAVAPLAVGGLACAACCAVPLIVPLTVGAAAAGGLEWLCGPLGAGAAVLTVAGLAGAAVAVGRRRRNA